MPDWVALCFTPFALWLLFSGLDDLVVALVFLWTRLRPRLRLPTDAELDAAPRQRIAIMVPLWHEHAVIEHMLEHNIAALRYEEYDIFAGSYPNDLLTQAAVRRVMDRHPNVHLALAPHTGPTSKADCLNWIYHHITLYEQRHQTRFEAIVIHDAEDLIHPDALRLVNYFTPRYDMVQIPVLALPTPLADLTHGVYCDEFAEFQTKDIPVRQLLGGFLPGNGAGTSFARRALEKLQHGFGRLFDATCLTEDYETGYQIYRSGGSQLFIPTHRRGGALVATREYFPGRFRQAIHQRRRWVTGIALQSWERHGWRAPRSQWYWLWRDRKGLVGNLISPVTNLALVYGGLLLAAGRPLPNVPPGLAALYVVTLSLSVVQTAFRIMCASAIYGWTFACLVPLRTFWGNCINGLATVHALQRYLWAKARRQALAWGKTDHVYPTRAALMAHKRKLGEILVAEGLLSAADLESALAALPPGTRLGEHLMRLGRLDEARLYDALSMQQGLPVGFPNMVSLQATRALPAAVVRNWKVLPFAIAEGKLSVASPELPSEAMTQELCRYCTLEIRFHLVTPGEFEELARQYLP